MLLTPSPFVNFCQSWRSNREVDSGRHDHQQLTQREERVYRRLAENVIEVIKGQKVIGESRQNGAQRQHGAQTAARGALRQERAVFDRTAAASANHSPPVASSTIRSSDAFALVSSPAILPRCMTRIRSATPRISSISDETTTTAVPSCARRAMRRSRQRRALAHRKSRYAPQRGAIFRGRPFADFPHSGWLPADPGWLGIRGAPAVQFHDILYTSFSGHPGQVGQTAYLEGGCLGKV